MVIEAVLTGVNSECKYASCLHESAWYIMKQVFNLIHCWRVNQRRDQVTVNEDTTKTFATSFCIHSNCLLLQLQSSISQITRGVLIDFATKTGIY